jgi:hypothetical protein
MFAQIFHHFSLFGELISLYHYTEKSVFENFVANEVAEWLISAPGCSLSAGRALSPQERARLHELCSSCPEEAYYEAMLADAGT